MTRRPVNGGGEVAMKVGTASLALSPVHGRERGSGGKVDFLNRAETRDLVLALVRATLEI